MSSLATFHYITATAFVCSVSIRVCIKIGHTDWEIRANIIGSQKKVCLTIRIFLKCFSYNVYTHPQKRNLNMKMLRIRTNARANRASKKAREHWARDDASFPGCPGDWNAVYVERDCATQKRWIDASASVCLPFSRFYFRTKKTFFPGSERLSSQIEVTRPTISFVPHTQASFSVRSSAPAFNLVSVKIRWNLRWISSHYLFLFVDAVPGHDAAHPLPDRGERGDRDSRAVTRRKQGNGMQSCNSRHEIQRGK